ncbi:MAG: tetratricopeptide repeat protein [Chloroflexi bacterium]|nr:tetratricopeptide repeat protein [Chloroflexota bacterium]
MPRDEFRAKTQQYLRAAGLTQKQLARELVLNATVLSHKLNETDQMRLTHPEIKGIVRLLAQWQAITTRGEAEDLLRLAELRPNIFTDEEWAVYPLGILEVMTADSSGQSTSSSTAATLSKHNLPAPTTQLFGRDAVMNDLCGRLMSPDVRLLTLTGMGGIGKTRLAIEVARKLAGSFQHGVMYVPLGEISEPVLEHLARSFNVESSGKTTALQTLIEHLSSRQLLLVLDNFEHLLEAAAQLRELLSAAPLLKILVTSRVVLNLYGEHQFSVPPLETPAPPEDSIPLKQLAQQPAVALFVARARAVQREFKLTEDNAPMIAAICSRLEGLPLALELAAARIRLLSPEALLARLDQRLTLLSTQARDVDARHRSLRATIDWSYQLLEPAEQHLFRWISLFPGGCTQEAAEALAETDTSTILEQMGSLLDKSLLVQRTGKDGHLRFTMLETLREYAFERFSDVEALHHFRQAQYHYYLNRLEQMHPQLDGEKQVEALDYLESEQDTLRVLLKWSSAEQPALLRRLCVFIWKFWHLRGYIREARYWLDQALLPGLRNQASKTDYAHYGELLYADGTFAYLAGDHETAYQRLNAALKAQQQLEDELSIASTLVILGNLAWDRSQLDTAVQHYQQALELAAACGNRLIQARALNNLGGLYWQRDDLTQAAEYLQAALSLWQQLGNQAGAAQTLSNLANVVLKRREYEPAEKLYRESLTLHRTLGNQQGIASTLSNIGVVLLHQADYTGAEDYFRQALELQREVNYAWGTGSALCNLGSALFFQGRYAEAAELLSQALAILRPLNDTNKIGVVLEYQGMVSLRQGNAAAALNKHQEALKLALDSGDEYGMASSLACIAAVLTVQGHPLQAARLWGAAYAVWTRSETQLLPTDENRFKPELQAARMQTSPAEFEAAWQAGTALTLLSAVDETLCYESIPLRHRNFSASFCLKTSPDHPYSTD